MLFTRGTNLSSHHLMVLLKTNCTTRGQRSPLCPVLTGAWPRGPAAPLSVTPKQKRQETRAEGRGAQRVRGTRYQTRVWPPRSWEPAWG